MTVQDEEATDLWLYFVVAYAFSWTLWIPGALVTQGAAPPTGLLAFLHRFSGLAAFGPLVSAFALTLLRRGPRGVFQLLRRGIDLRFKKSWLAAALLLPIALFGGPVWVSVLVGARRLDLSVISNPPYAAAAFFVILLTSGPLQEEFGWRGYALPRLQSRYGAMTASAVVGVFWWLWHLPAVFIPGRFMTGDLVIFAALLPEIVLASVVFTWIYNNTNGSVLAAMLTHTSMNWSIWLAMPDMKMDLITVGLTIIFLAAALLVILKARGAGSLDPKRVGVSSP